jgi:hypothetical protein
MNRHVMATTLLVAILSTPALARTNSSTPETCEFDTSKKVTVQGAVHIERIGVPSVACCGEKDRTGGRTPTSDWSGRTNGFVANWPNVNGS